MSVFDLLFIFVFFGTVILVFVILVNLLRGRRSSARRSSRVLGIGLAAYLLIVAIVAILSPQKVLTIGQNRCFDEMCFAVMDVKVTPTVGSGQRQIHAKGTFYIVTIRVTCQGHGRAQSEAGVGVSCLDSKGNTYKVSLQGQRTFETANTTNPSLTDRVPPGESISCVQVFDLPPDASDVALHVSHSGPGLFIIGDDESPLHKPTIIRLTP